jgi:two-component system OmpR family response regulator
MRLLVVEDFEILRESLARGLAQNGFAVDATGDGREGLWYATSNDYDAVILDIMLPGMSGLDILRRMRSAGRQAPVLLLTAKDAVDDRVAGLDLGADDYLTKPFATTELLARVRALVRRGHQRREPTITIGDLRIDTVARAVTRGGRDIALTPREYQLLEYLALHAGRAVARAEIWEHLYAFAEDSSSNVVEATVARLRRKLEAPDSPELLHTRRGFGYVLAEKEPTE